MDLVLYHGSIARKMLEAGGRIVLQNHNEYPGRKIHWEK
jgi:hypothetical protein